MRNFYFFKHIREYNNSGEYRHELQALPGQVTYNIATRSSTPVLTTQKVQCSNVMRRKVCDSDIGTVFGMKIVGNTPYAASLKTYLRNEINFYRVDDAVSMDECRDEEMLTAYRVLLNTEEPTLPMDTAAEEEPARAGGGTPASGTEYPARMTDLNATAPLMRAVAMGPAAHSMENADMILVSRFFDRATSGILSFTYVKNSDGFRRRALGTRNSQAIEAYAAEHGIRRPENRNGNTPFDGEHVVYFDLERGEWRSFTAERLLSIDMNSFIPADRAEEISAAVERWNSAAA